MDNRSGWYDSVYDEELGVEPSLFKSITPVRCIDATYLLFVLGAYLISFLSAICSLSTPSPGVEQCESPPARKQDQITSRVRSRTSFDRRKCK